jgi:hypothetical protein
MRQAFQWAISGRALGVSNATHISSHRARPIESAMHLTSVHTGRAPSRSRPSRFLTHTALQSATGISVGVFGSGLDVIISNHTGSGTRRAPWITCNDSRKCDTQFAKRIRVGPACAPHGRISFFLFFISLGSPRKLRGGSSISKTES